MENIISTKNLTFSYPQEDNSVLKGIDLEIKQGQLVAILGHNGSGKSTFAKHINAILLPSGGTCYVDGINTQDEEKILALRATAGMVFQNPDNQIVATVVEEDVAFGLENLGVEPNDIRIRVDKALKEVGMYDFRLHAPHQLSGGQKQRVAIAGIIAMRPKIIVLDEPTAMLDPKGRKEVLDTISTLNKEFGVTVLLITHYMDEAAKCDRIVVMDEGKVVLDDTPKRVFSHAEALRNIGLDVPQATDFINSLRRYSINLPDDIISASECITVLDEYLNTHGENRAPLLQDDEIENVVSDDVVLKVEGLKYIYSQNTPFERVAVDDISIEIQRGDFVGVIGHTGSGKSTLIQHLNGLLKPSEGKIYLNGKNIWENPKEIRDVRFKVGLVFQYPEYQLFEETVYKDIAFGPGNMGLDADEIKARVLEAVKFVGLPMEVMEKSPFELSGGQKRRVAIAGVLAMRPDVLILDEPTAGLDPKGREQIFAMIKEYHKSTNSTIMLVSHSMEDVAKVANRVIVINEGKLFDYDYAPKVFKRGRELAAMGLSVPQITSIFMGLKEKGHNVSENVYTIKAATKQFAFLVGKEGK